MSIERVYYCDWRECKAHVRTVSDHPPQPFLTVAGDADDTQHFCGWDCLLRFAGEKPPEITIPLEEAA